MSSSQLKQNLWLHEGQWKEGFLAEMVSWQPRQRAGLSGSSEEAGLWRTKRGMGKRWWKERASCGEEMRERPQTEQSMGSSQYLERHWGQRKPPRRSSRWQEQMEAWSEVEEGKPILMRAATSLEEASWTGGGRNLKNSS